MGLKDVISIILRKKRSSVTTVANVEDYGHLPSRENLSLDEVKKLDDFKKKYIDILKKSRVVYSKELDSKELRNKMNMCINILLNMLELEEDKPATFEKIYKIKSDGLDNMIKLAKLRYYFCQIESMEEDAKLMLLALTEISKERFFVFSDKNKTIREERNNLLSNYISFENQKYAIQWEVERYLFGSDLGISEEETVKDELLEGKYKELMKMLQLVAPEKLEHYKTINIATIVLMEVELESYVYFHQSEVGEIRKRLLEMEFHFYDHSLSKNYNEEIKEMELKFKIFNEYGRELITEEDINRFYHLKFDILTSDIQENFDLNFVKDCTYQELECYIKIIDQKIQDIVMGTNPNLNAPNIQSKEILPILIQILKNGEKEFSSWDILNDQRRLRLLLSFDQHDSLEFFFQCMESIDHYLYFSKFSSFSDGFSWEELISYESIYRMVGYTEELNLFSAPEKEKNIEMLYYSLYLLYKKYYFFEKKTFRFPEGITKIDFCTGTRFTNLLNKEMKGKYVYMPPSLKALNHYPFSNEIRNVYLNSGLEDLGLETFADLKSQDIYIYEDQLECDWVKKSKRPFKIIGMNTVYISKEVIENYSGAYQSSFGKNVDILMDESFFVGSLLFQFFTYSCRKNYKEIYPYESTCNESIECLINPRLDFRYFIVKTKNQQYISVSFHDFCGTFEIPKHLYSGDFITSRVYEWVMGIIKEKGIVLYSLNEFYDSSLLKRRRQN